MITIENLHEATEKEIFEHVSNHLVNQGVKSEKYYPQGGYKACVYRTVDGQGNTLRCAAGCLIPDHMYTSDMENTTWGGLVEDHDFPESPSELIHILQKTHDWSDVKDWGRVLLDIASNHDIEISDTLRTKLENFRG